MCTNNTNIHKTHAHTKQTQNDEEPDQAHSITFPHTQATHTYTKHIHYTHTCSHDTYLNVSIVIKI